MGGGVRFVDPGATWHAFFRVAGHVAGVFDMAGGRARALRVAERLSFGGVAERLGVGCATTTR